MMIGLNHHGNREAFIILLSLSLTNKNTIGAKNCLCSLGKSLSVTEAITNHGCW